MFHEEDDVFVVDPEDDMVPLDSIDTEFIRGIEVGYMLQAAICGFYTQIRIHSSNIEMVMRIADAYELEFSAEDTEDPDMITVTLLPPDFGECTCGDDEDDDS